MTRSPFAPPEAALGIATRGIGEPAKRGARLAAAVIDWILIIPFMMGAMLLAYWIDPAVLETFDPATLASHRLEMNVFSFVIYVATHGYLLHNYGQTVGKRLVNIAIVGRNGEVPSLGRIFGLRVLPITVAAKIPLIGRFAFLIDTLFVFRKDRRCIHDFIAGTRVIDLSGERFPAEPAPFDSRG